MKFNHTISGLLDFKISGSNRPNRLIKSLVLIHIQKIHIKRIDIQTRYPLGNASDTQVTYNHNHYTASLTPRPNRYWELLRARRSKALEHWVSKSLQRP